MKPTRIGDRKLSTAPAGASTWPELWALWNEAGVAHVLRPQTRINYATAIHAAAALKLPDRPTVGDVQRWMLALVARMGKAPATANSYAASMRAICERAGELAGDASVGLAFRAALRRPLRVPRREAHMPPDDAAQVALAVARSLAEVAWVRIEVETGARPSETLALIRAALDSAVCIVTFRAHREGNNASTVPYRKNARAGAHYAKVTPETMRLLLWCVEHNAELGPLHGMRSRDAGLRVFPWSQRYTDNFMERIRASLGARADLYFPVRVDERTGARRAGEGWKAFRHLGAWTLARLGASVHQIQLWLGDSTEEVAQGYCARARGALHLAAAFAPTPVTDVPGALARALLPETTPAPGAKAEPGSHEGEKDRHPSAPQRAGSPARERAAAILAPAGAVAIAAEIPSPPVNGGNAGSIIIEAAFADTTSRIPESFPKEGSGFRKVTPAGNSTCISNTHSESEGVDVVDVERSAKVEAVAARKPPQRAERSRSEKLRGRGGDSKSVDALLTAGGKPEEVGPCPK